VFLAFKKLLDEYKNDPVQQRRFGDVLQLLEVYPGCVAPRRDQDDASLMEL
jgi:hypothetical protein